MQKRQYMGGGNEASASGETGPSGSSPRSPREARALARGGARASDRARRSAPQALRREARNIPNDHADVAPAEPALVLIPGRERSLLRRHPWVFSGAIARVTGNPTPGSTIAVMSGEGRFLAWAAWSPHSQIRARVWSFDRADAIDAAWVEARVQAAIARRRLIPGRAEVQVAMQGAMRLVHSEADGLPGLVVDRYADTLVVQINSAGAERWREAILGALRTHTGHARMIERSDDDARQLEGLPPRSGWLDVPVAIGASGTGGRSGGEGDHIDIVENGIRYAVDVVNGQKTGFFLDQRDNRQMVGTLARDAEVLNCFCYTGGFTLSALAGGARSVLSVDSSAPALQLARRNLALNGLDASRAEWRQADVFALLRELLREERRFDLIVLDPPKFAPTSRDAERAARGYKDINLCALKLLSPGGRLATFSCSSGVNADLFRKIVAGAAADAGVSCIVEDHFHAAADHPVLLEFPEGDYLKGLLLRLR